MIVPDRSSTAIAPADREAFSFWPALNLPTSIVPSRRVRDRSHLVCVPMDDLDDNAWVVNALQRWSTIVVQKSLAEGFGLTVTEPMWKGRPVVASAVGGIRDQIEDGVSGVLLDDPRDGAALVAALSSLLGDADRRREMGRAAHLRVRDHYLADRHLIQYAELFAQLVG